MRGGARASVSGVGASRAAGGDRYDRHARDGGHLNYDLAALLDVLGLTERDILPKMSSRNQARLGVGQGRGALVGHLGGEASHDRKPSAPWVLLEEVGLRPAEVAAMGRAGLSANQIKEVTKSHPRILDYDVEAKLEPHAEWLEREGLTTRASIAKVICDHPQILGLNISSNLSPKTKWLRSYLGLSTRGVATIIKAEPHLVEQAVWLEKRLGLDRQGVAKVLVRRPQLFWSRTDSVETKLGWLREGLGLDESDIGRVIRDFPVILGYSVEENMQPKLAWLREGLGLKKPDIARVIRLSPHILGYSVEENLKPTTEWLTNRMRLDQKGLAAIVQRCPYILGLSPNKNMEPKLAWLKENLDLDDGMLVDLVKACPGLLKLSAESNLGPTLDFFRRKLGGSREEIREVVCLNPNLLSSSLKKRMIPRVAVMEEAGLGPPVFRHHVRAIAGYTNLAFDQWLDSLLDNQGLPPRQNSVSNAETAAGVAGAPAAAAIESGGPNLLLVVAASLGQADTVNLLLRAGASTAAKFRLGQTALYETGACGSPEIAQSLIDAGADVSIRNDEGHTPLYSSPKKAIPRAIHLAAQAGDAKVARLIVQVGGDVNTTTSDEGYTPLRIAVHGNDTALIGFLLRAGAQVSVADHCSITPLHVAAATRPTALVVQLLESLEQQDDEMRALRAALALEESEGRTALHDASLFVRVRTVDTLLRYGAIETHRNHSGNTPSSAFMRDDYKLKMISKGVIVETRKVSKSDEDVRAIIRSLARGPAFRARSWLWSTALVVDDTKRRPWKVYPICARRVRQKKPFSFMVAASRYNALIVTRPVRVSC
eukprot:g13285.t2